MNACPHCGSGDVAPLFNSFECLACGRHSTTDGRKILPDSLCIGPNTPGNLEEFGWPYEDPSPSHDRSDEICAVQWGISLREEAAMSDVPPVEPQPEPEPEPQPEEVPA